jgi:hypothetical protein
VVAELKSHNKNFKQDKIQLAFCSLRSPILANYILPLKWALGFSQMKRIFLLLFITLSSYSVFSRDYLEPIPPFSSLGYNEALVESFIDNDSPELWMIVSSSFELPYAVILHKKTDKYVLTSAKLNEKIFKYKKVGNRNFVDIKPTKNIEYKSNSFEFHELDEIVYLWAAGLKLTRYPSERVLGKDGTTYLFYSKGELYGRTWSPKKGFALNFVKLGGVLHQLSVKSSTDRSELLMQAKELASMVGD